MKKKSPLTFNHAFDTVLKTAPLCTSERIPLIEAAGRVLAADIRSDVNMPPMDLSTMDGYACRSQDRDRTLTVIETIAAGTVPAKTVTAGTCSRIMTGAPVPRGADTVVMFEDTVFDNKKETVTIVNNQENRNIRFHAEDVCKGDIVLQKGALIEAPHIAILSSVGKSLVRVTKKPRVGIIATGDELVEPNVRPRMGQIRNSNSYQLFAQVKQCGAEPIYFGIVKDDPTSLDKALKKALPKCEVLLLSGGVSMGDFDFVPQILKQNGITLQFEKIAIKPGKPTVYGTAGKKRLFGMPGNPVSTFVIFEILVKPFLYKMMGYSFKRMNIRLTCAKDITRKNADRQEFRPIFISADGMVEPFEYHGSAHIHAYTYADGIISIPADQKIIRAGTTIEVILLR